MICVILSLRTRNDFGLAVDYDPAFASYLNVKLSFLMLCRLRIHRRTIERLHALTIAQSFVQIAWKTLFLPGIQHKI
jgi:hypothetical protein